MDPSSQLHARWRQEVDTATTWGHLDAVLEDQADNLTYTSARPCNFSSSAWFSATDAMDASLKFPIIYNGLGQFHGTWANQK